VARQRKDFLHKLSTTIAKNHGAVVLEKLEIRGMTRSAAGTIEQPGRNVPPGRGFPAEHQPHVFGLRHGRYRQPP
jgi:transposase